VKFFRAKTPPKEAVGMVGTEVGALFRFLAHFTDPNNDANPELMHLALKQAVLKVPKLV
jgi:hypothetical protein